MKVASPVFVPCGFGPAMITTLLPPLSKERMTAPSSPRSLADAQVGIQRPGHFFSNGDDGL